MSISYYNRKREKAYSQTSRHEKPEELQLHHNHENFLFLTVLLQFAPCKSHTWWLVTLFDLAYLTIELITLFFRVKLQFLTFSLIQNNRANGISQNRDF
jgi:hypothetical protein